MKPLIANVNMAGWVLTADALHTVRESARHLARDIGAYYVLMVKGNQPTLLAAAMTRLVAGVDAEHEQAGTGHTDLDRGHGRSERRTIRTAPADGIDFPGAVQVFRIVRHVATLTGSGVSKEVAYGITNMTAELAGPAHLNHYVRSHWGVETREHYVRDVTFREDAGHIRTGRLPQVMATCRNLAIGRPATSTRVQHVRILVDAPIGEVEPLVIRTPGIAERVLSVMRAESAIPAWSAPDLLKRLAGTTENQVHKCLYRLTRSGVLRRISHGTYELLTAWPSC